MEKVAGNSSNYCFLYQENISVGPLHTLPKGISLKYIGLPTLFPGSLILLQWTAPNPSPSLFYTERCCICQYFLDKNIYLKKKRS